MTHEGGVEPINLEETRRRDAKLFSKEDGSNMLLTELKVQVLDDDQNASYTSSS